MNFVRLLTLSNVSYYDTEQEILDAYRYDSRLYFTAINYLAVWVNLTDKWLD